VTSKLSPRLLQQMLLEKFINDLLNSLKATESPGPVSSLEDNARILKCHLKQGQTRRRKLPE
jgi:hypothetical protein